MRYGFLTLILMLCGCSTAPLAGTLDCLLPSRPRVSTEPDRFDEPRSSSSNPRPGGTRLERADEPRTEISVLPSPSIFTDTTPRERASDLPR